MINRGKIAGATAATVSTSRATGPDTLKIQPRDREQAHETFYHACADHQTYAGALQQRKNNSKRAAKLHHGHMQRAHHTGRSRLNVLLQVSTATVKTNQALPQRATMVAAKTALRLDCP